MTTIKCEHHIRHFLILNNINKYKQITLISTLLLTTLKISAFYLLTALTLSTYGKEQKYYTYEAKNPKTNPESSKEDGFKRYGSASQLAAFILAQSTLDIAVLLNTSAEASISSSLSIGEDLTLYIFDTNILELTALEKAAFSFYPLTEGIAVKSDERFEAELNISPYDDNLPTSTKAFLQTEPTLISYTGEDGNFPQSVSECASSHHTDTSAPLVLHQKVTPRLPSQIIAYTTNTSINSNDINTIESSELSQSSSASTSSTYSTRLNTSAQNSKESPPSLTAASEQLSRTTRAYSPSQSVPVAASEIVEYRVIGIEEIDADESSNMTFNSTSLALGLTINLIGADVTKEDGTVEESSLDGGGLYSGFAFIHASGSSYDATVNLSGVKNFTGFYKTGINAAGGAFNFVNGGFLNFGDLSTQVDITFSNNIVKSSSGHSDGGAISLTGGAIISDMKADFEYNKVVTAPYTGSAQYARGGAINVYNATIGNIEGNFIGNEAAYGGAIYLNTRGKIGNITGNFINNRAEGALQPGGATGGCNGGAIRSNGGIIGDIYGTFAGNTARSTGGAVSGGAVSLENTTMNGNFSGSFENNLAFSDNAAAYGGAIIIKKQSGENVLNFNNVDFVGNVAGTVSTNSSSVRGGAIYIENSNAVFLNASGSEELLISNNYTVTGAEWNDATDSIKEDENSVRQYNGIYLYSSGSNTTKLTLNADNDSSIVINDGITGTGVGNSLVINENSSKNYGVHLNGDIGVQNLIINTGGVQLSSFVHDDGSTTTGRLVDESNVTINQTGNLRTDADNLDSAGNITLTGTGFGTAGRLELTGGSLNSHINNTGTHTGQLHITGKTSIDANHQINVETVSIYDNLTLMESVSINVDALFFYGYDKHDVNDGGNQIISHSSTDIDINTMELYFGEAEVGDVFDLIVFNPNEEPAFDVSSFEVKVFSVSGRVLDRNTAEYRVFNNDTGGVSVEILVKVTIPEPSTATLGLLALTGLCARRRRSKCEK